MTNPSVRVETPVPAGRLFVPDAGSDGKLAARIARRIEAGIIENGWPVGRNLGSEGELRRRYGISRSVLREAVRLVEHHSVARMRRGPGGGFFVTAPDTGSATRAIVIYLEYLGTSAQELLHARSLVEPLAAASAARRLTEDEVGVLRRAVTEGGDGAAAEWVPGAGPLGRLHSLLGTLSGNPAVRLFVDVLIEFSEHHADQVRRVSKTASEQVRADALLAHEQIAEAVIAGDAGQASALMAGHLQAVAEWLGRYQRRRSPALSGRPASVALGDAGDTKMGEALADRIREEIAYRGRPIGEVLGSEPELLARYQVGRAVLREAVRILEYHSVARMRRGPGGGLVVTAPDPTASVETMALYLDYQRVTPQDLRAVRETIELGCIDLVVERRELPGLMERLSAAAAAAARGCAPGAESSGFHAELGELSGNPVLALFQRIVTELSTRQADRSRSGAEPGRREAHRKIVEAIAAGDVGLARHRMRRHLESVAEGF